MPGFFVYQFSEMRECAVQRRIHIGYQSLFLIHNTAITAMTMPSSHSQYCSSKPFSAGFGAGAAVTTGGVGSCGAATGASCVTTGAGATTGSTGAALATFLLAFLTTGFGAGCSVATAGAGCSATVVEASAGAASGAAATAAGAGSATAASCVLVAQADKASADINRATGMAALSILDMVFSWGTVVKMR